MGELYKTDVIKKPPPFKNNFFVRFRYEFVVAPLSVEFGVRVGSEVIWNIVPAKAR